MTHCTRCGRELRTTLDEYGPDLLRPLCVACWLAVERETEREREREQEVLEPELARRRQKELGL